MRLWTVESGFESLGGNSKNNKARQSVVIDGLLFLLEVSKGYNYDSSLSASIKEGWYSSYWSILSR